MILLWSVTAGNVFTTGVQRNKYMNIKTIHEDPDDIVDLTYPQVVYPCLDGHPIRPDRVRVSRHTVRYGKADGTALREL